MSASFKLTLDTQTHVGVSINGGSPQTLLDTVTLDLDLDADAIEVKIWGDINPLDPANSEYGETEESAPWIAASPSFLVNLTTNPGQKRLSARVKDDVWNEATGTDTILYGEEVAPPPRPKTQVPKPLPGKPEPRRPEPVLEEVRVVSTGVALTTSATAQVRVASRSRGVTTETMSSLIQSRTATQSSGFQISTRVQSYITPDVKPSRIEIGVAGPPVIVRRDDPNLLAILDALGEL